MTFSLDLFLWFVASQPIQHVWSSLSFPRAVRSLPDMLAGGPASGRPGPAARRSRPIWRSTWTPIRDRYARLTALIPGPRVHYAVKCNPDQAVLRCLAEEGCRFEVASIGELDLLRSIGVDPVDVLYSNPVKPPAHVAAAHKAGALALRGRLRRRASQDRPKRSRRRRVRPPARGRPHAAFPLSRKFGAEADVARSLLVQARQLGLRPYGLTFHVGSQCAAPKAWRSAIASAGRLMHQLTNDGIHLQMLDLGGGFPACYGPPVPAIEALRDHDPGRP